MSTRALLLVLAFGASAPRPSDAQATTRLPPSGTWEAPFMHPLTGFPASVSRFNAIHLALIPKGPLRGKVIAFDADSDDSQPEWRQRWSIMNPVTSTPIFANRLLVMPAGGGDLFCAGHAWTADGNLFVAGGTTRYPDYKRPLHGGAGFDGGKLAYIFAPTVGSFGTWFRQADMAVDRWYPTVQKLPDGTLLVAGGSESTPEQPYVFNHYEVFLTSTPTTGVWQGNGGTTLFPGPTGLGPFSIYPRLVQLSTGVQFLAGMTSHASTLNHLANPGVWTRISNGGVYDYRSYSTPVHMPLIPDAHGNYQDEVMVLGGFGVGFEKIRSKDGEFDLLLAGSLSLVETCRPGSPIAAERQWQLGPELAHQRTVANAVILADGTVLAIGGRISGNDASENPVFVPEQFDGSSWSEAAPHASALTYHSTALLLPDAKVLTAGGNTATWDYQIFVPAYLNTGMPRPVVTNAPAAMGYQSVAPEQHTIVFDPLPVGQSVARAVLVNPGSVTHHADTNQRYVQLVTVGTTATSITVEAPRDSNLVTKGYYMLFLLTADGVPSEAVWVTVG